ncbi:tripartite tricarboxylate transporter substrate-binding protein [Ottowia sp.]|uniref:tripartite tricarboxylate transporter substrate-binding protein n=1 Tax=Ottowia sp. TaxID=1898956 RepID=UPI003451A9C9
MVVPVKSPWKTLKDIVDAAKKSPTGYTYGSAVSVAPSTWPAHSSRRPPRSTSGRPPVESGPAAQDLLAGHIDMMIDTGSRWAASAAALRPIAVASSKRYGLTSCGTDLRGGRHTDLASAWYASAAARNTQLSVVQRSNDSNWTRSPRSAEVRQKLIDTGAEVGAAVPVSSPGSWPLKSSDNEGVVKDSGRPRSGGPTRCE